MRYLQNIFAIGAIVAAFIFCVFAARGCEESKQNAIVECVKAGQAPSECKLALESK